MFGDEIILRGEAAYQNVKGTFPGNRGYLVGSSLAGKPYPPHGIAVVWTGISWKPEGITPLDSVDDLQAYAGVEGAVASVNGVQYTYGAGGWVERVDGVECFETVDERNIAYPTAPKTGTEVGIRRLCGNGYFYQRYNGTRWESFGSIVMDAGVNGAGYVLTAASAGALVQMAAYTIPAGLFGIGEEWKTAAFVRNNGVYTSGSDRAEIQIGGVAVSSNMDITTLNAVSHGQGVFANFGNTTLGRRRNVGMEYANAGLDDFALNFANPISVSAHLAGGAVGHVVKLRQWGVTRVV